MERLLVYKQIKNEYPEKVGVRVVEFDRSKLKHDVVREFKFEHTRIKHKYLVPLSAKLATVARNEKCSAIVGDQEFRINYLFEKYRD